ncbi:MAG: hypothetical protein UW75_C0016G0008 [Parcubacteria group bacterium GW2011_GWF2_44_8]|nr:MAG: hypothetical protein UW75_C0016G0008 [Parcubacteria group bacterium GW2011_GWF2_44_8]
MKNADNKFSTLCPCGMNASWTGFDWEKYPGGVQVSFALISGKRLLLVRPVHWNRVMPQYNMKRSDTLEGAKAVMYKDLEKLSIKVSGVGAASVQQVLEKSGTLHVLVVVPYSQVSGPGSSGFSVSNPMVRFVPELLGWPDSYIMTNDEKVLQVA